MQQAVRRMGPSDGLLGEAFHQPCDPPDAVVARRHSPCAVRVGRVRNACATVLRVLLAMLALAASGAVWAQAADLVLSNQVISPAAVFPTDTRATIKMLITNQGPDAATGVKLTDALPAGARFVSMQVTGGTCTASFPYECTLPSMALDAQATVTLVLDFPTPGHQVNTATLSSSTPDPNTFNDTSTSDATVYASANLRLAASSVASGDTVAGGAIDYTLQVGNAGASALPAGSAPTVTFGVPAGATLTGVPTGDGWTCTPDAASYPLSNPPSNGSVVRCTRDDGLAVGASYPDILVPAVGNVNGTVTANFGVSSNVSEGNASDNTAVVDVVVVDGTDMAMDKTVSPSGTAVAPGARVRFTLQAKQYGGVTPTNVTVTDELPVGLTHDPASLLAPSPWQCAWTDQTLRCVYPGPYLGGAFTSLPPIAFDAIVDMGVTGALMNEGVVAADQSDPDSSNDASQATVATSSTADQQLTKTASVSIGTVGTPYSFRLAARNLGPVNVQPGQLITVTDAIPAGMSLTAMPSGAGWSCRLDPSPPGPVVYPLAGPVGVACTRTDGVGTPSNWAVITVPVVNTVAGTTRNSACVQLSSTAGQPADTNASNDCRTAALTVNPVNTGQADLAISKTASGNPTLAGDYMLYTVTVTNNGPDESTNVVVTDNVRDLSYVVNSLRSVRGSAPEGGAICSHASGRFMNVDVSCTFPRLKVGDTATMTLEVLPSQTTALTKTRTNKASVASLDVEDPNSANNTTTISTAVDPRVDITAGKTVAPATVHVEEPLSFTVSVSNSGPSIASNVRLSDPMPAHTRFMELSSVSGGGSCTVPAVGATAGTIECSWGTVAIGAQQTAVYKLLPTKDAANTTLHNTVVASTSTIESNTSNNAATASAAVVPAQLDILVQKTDSLDPLELGALTEYTITISNAGPSDGTQLVMTDTFPNAKASARFSYQGGLTTSEPAIACVEPPVGSTSGTLQCRFVRISKSRDITVKYKMKSESIVTPGDYSGTQGNDVQVKVDEPETLLSNNLTTEDTTTRRDPVLTDMALTKQVDKTAMKPGETAAYTLTVNNNGPSPSTGAQIIDVLPAGLTFVASADGCVDSAGTVTCSVGPLASGASKIFRFDVLLAKPYAGASPIVNRATVDAPGDTNPANNQADASTTVTPDTPVNPGAKPAPIPTLGQVGLLLMGLCMAGLGVVQLRRRR